MQKTIISNGKSMSLNQSVTMRVINKVGRLPFLHFVILFKISASETSLSLPW